MDDDDGIVAEEDSIIYQSVKQTPNFFVNLYDTITGTFENYGWYILIGCILLYYIYTKLSDQLSRQRNTRQKTAATNKKDDSVAVEQLMRIEEVRRRQQAAIDEAAAKHLLEKKLKEEEKLKEKEADFERLQEGRSYRSKLKPTDTDHQQSPDKKANEKNDSANNPKPKFRQNDYNPLTGSGGGSCSYRPGKRGNAKGG